MEDKKQQDAQKYFLDLFKSYIRNYNKIFCRKYTPSIRELLNDYIELYNDVVTSPENLKLKSSLKAQLDVMHYYINNTELKKSKLKINLDMLEKKINCIITNNSGKGNLEIKDNLHVTSDYFAILKICSSLLKSLKQINIYELIISIITSATTFAVIDRCTEHLINELLYDGYSIRYLHDWYRDMQKKYINDTASFVNSFIELKKPKNEYRIYFTVKNDCNNLSLKHISDTIELNPIDKSALDLEIASHLLFNETNRAYEVTIKCMDEYSAANQIIKAFDSYCLIVNLMESKEFRINQKIASFCNGKINKFNNRSNDLMSILPNLDNHEKNDLEDFLKYRKQVYQQKLEVGEIFTIERSLNILKNGNYENDANTLINLWNVLEGILSYYSGDSIISKARYIIPKLMCLYYLKDKLNIFWNTLQKSRGYDELVEEFISNSIHEKNSDKYDVSKLLTNIIKYDKELSIHFGTNKNILVRKYNELGSIIAGKTDLYAEIQKLHKIIEYDIVRIYRTRNILVHSGNTTKTNILLKNARLMQYNSNLMGVILHYKMKNSNHSISEILYSIPVTYDNYIINCKDFEQGPSTDIKRITEIFKPTYLFL